MKVTARHLVRGRGQHRAPRPAGALVGQEFRYCPRCEVETAAVVHGDGSHTCTETHQTVPGDPT